jgi:cytochrome P450
MEVLRDPERFRTDAERSPIRDTFGEQMLSSEGDAQRRYKSACAPPFNARAVADVAPTIRGIASRLLSALSRMDAVDLRTCYAAPIALETVARVMGLPPTLDEQLREWYDVFAEALMNYERDAPTRARAHAAALAFRSAIQPVLDRPDPTGEQLLMSLARNHPRVLNDSEIGANALIVLFGGIETTEATIANTIWALAMHPDAMARARSSDDALERSIEETLRWESAVQTATRYVARDTELHGATLGAGDTLQCMLGAMNRDPRHFAAPDTFDPWRSDATTHAAFGFGRHFCLGAALARLEAGIAMRVLLNAAPRLRLEDPLGSRPVGHEFRKPAHLLASL